MGEHFARELREQREASRRRRASRRGSPRRAARLGSALDLGVDRVDLRAPGGLPEEARAGPRRCESSGQASVSSSVGSVDGISSVRNTRPPAAGKKYEPPRVLEVKSSERSSCDLERACVGRPAGRGARARGNAEDPQVLVVRAAVVGPDLLGAHRVEAVVPADVVPAVHARARGPALAAARICRRSARRSSARAGASRRASFASRRARAARGAQHLLQEALAREDPPHRDARAVGPEREEERRADPARARRSPAAAGTPSRVPS